MSKSVALLLVLVCAASCLIASIIITNLPIKAEPKTIVVPDDYSTIQEAVDNAPEGSTVFVKSGKYENTVRIGKRLSLIGENPENTIIETPKIIFSEAVIFVDSENVTVSGFTIRNCDYAFWAGSRCKIIGNKIEGAEYGIAAGGKDTTISGNEIVTKYDGIRADLNDSIISGNIIKGGRNIGLSVGSGKDLTIYNNTISTNAVGIQLRGTGPFYVYGNNVTSNKAFGIQLFGCNNASIYENNIEDNDVGVELENYRLDGEASGSGNTVYQNNFVNNQRQVVFDKTWNVLQWDLTEYYPDAVNGTDSASWHKDNVGNYWSDYFGAGAYVIDGNNVDYYPLTQQVDIATTAPTPKPATTPTGGFPLITIVTIFIVLTVVTAMGLLIYFKKRKRRCL